MLDMFAFYGKSSEKLQNWKIICVGDGEILGLYLELDFIEGFVERKHMETRKGVCEAILFYIFCCFSFPANRFPHPISKHTLKKKSDLIHVSSSLSLMDN